MFEFLAASPILLLALLVLLGTLLGGIRFGGAYLGPAAVLFVALGLTYWAANQGVELSVPEILGSFGLVLFTFSVGVISGPSFFGSLRRGWPIMLSTVACLAVAALVAIATGMAMGLPGPIVAGTFAGALTNTPALAAASQVAGDAELPALGYSISYLWGVIGILLAATWTIRRGERDGTSSSPKLEQRTVQVDLPDGPTVAEVLSRYPGGVSISRVQHGDGHTVVGAPGERLQPGDLVSLVGPASLLDEVTVELGHVSTVDLIGDRTHLDSNRVTLSTHRTWPGSELPNWAWPAGSAARFPGSVAAMST